MRDALFILIIIILTYLFYIYYFKHSYYNTVSINSCSESDSCENYNVHRVHNDKGKAADLMKEITRRNKKLIEHLRNKYITSKFNLSMENVKNNRIDVLTSSDIFPWSAESMFDVDKIDQMKEIVEGEYIRERVNQLLSHYNPTKMYEISPLNSSGVTSYTQDKKTLILCLRKKELNAQGHNELHDINTIMFVDIHELSHMMNNLWGHKMNFWVLFKFMLMNSVECGIYKPVDYSKNPITYCGLALTYSPLFDPIV